MNNTTNVHNATAELRWHCLNRFSAVIVEDSSFIANNIAIIIVLVLAIFTSLILNSMLLYTIYQDQSLRNSSIFFAGLLAAVNILTSIIAQLPYLITKVFVATSLWKQHQPTFCCFLGSYMYGGRFTSLYSTACVLAISTDRYIAVFNPHRYTSKTAVRKIKITMGCVFLIQTIHAALYVAHLEWYEMVTQIVGLVQIPGILLYVVLIYVKIHRKLKVQSVYVNKRSTINMARQKRRMRTSAMVVTVFLICFLPLPLVQAFNPNFQVKNSFVNLYLTPWLLTWLFMAASINPVVYGLRDGRLGQGMREHLKRVVCRNKPEATPVESLPRNTGVNKSEATPVESLDLPRDTGTTAV